MIPLNKRSSLVNLLTEKHNFWMLNRLKDITFGRLVLFFGELNNNKKFIEAYDAKTQIIDRDNFIDFVTLSE